MRTHKTIRGSTVKAVLDQSLDSEGGDWGWWIYVEGSSNRVGRQALRQWAAWIIATIDRAKP